MEAPPISAAMESALRKVGLSLTEEIVYTRGTAAIEGSSRAPIALLFPGMVRLCDSSEQYMRFVLAQKDVSALFLLQSESDYRFTLCHNNIRAAATATHMKHLVLGRQHFVLRADVCSSHSTTHLNLGATLDGSGGLSTRTERAHWPRVQMQTFAVGRAWNVAEKLLPPAMLYIRARLDSFHCVPQWPAPSWAASTIVFDKLTYPRGFHADQPGLPADMFAIVPRKAAHYYFDAWRVWEHGIACLHRCLAFDTIDGAARTGPAIGGPLPGGECPLTIWTRRHVQAFEWRAMTGFEPFPLPKEPIGEHGAVREGCGGPEYSYNASHANLWGAIVPLNILVEALHAARRSVDCSSTAVNVSHNLYTASKSQAGKAYLQYIFHHVRVRHSTHANQSCLVT